jgi:hypothetical protein
MTPEERNLVIELFDRLGTLEDARRDPEAERLIRDGLRQAPNAVYSLVQTVLVQDEALKRADERIRELEQRAEPDSRDTSFLGSMRQSMSSRSGSVPSVRDSAVGGVSSAWRNSVAAAPPPQAQPAAPPPQAQSAAPPQSSFTGGSFLGTAAAAAAGVIGGSLLLNSFRSMLGTSVGNQHSLGSFADTNRNSPWGGDTSTNTGTGDLARSVGIDDIGRSPAASDDGRSSLLDSNDSNVSDDSASDADSFFGDGDADFGSSDGD